jgi:hypothetical protein
MPGSPSVIRADGCQTTCWSSRDTRSGYPAAVLILTGLRGGQLDVWIATAGAGDQPDLRSFITGLKRDHQAVLNGLTLPSSSGKVEGNVNKTILKRQMYGRARFDLLPQASPAGMTTAETIPKCGAEPLSDESHNRSRRTAGELSEVMDCSRISGPAH